MTTVKATFTFDQVLDLAREQVGDLDITDDFASGFRQGMAEQLALMFPTDLDLEARAGEILDLLTAPEPVNETGHDADSLIAYARQLMLSLSTEETLPLMLLRMGHPTEGCELLLSFYEYQPPTSLFRASSLQKGKEYLVIKGEANPSDREAATSMWTDAVRKAHMELTKELLKK